MRLVIQRVKEAKVIIEGRTISEIGEGLVILLGIQRGDDLKDADFLIKKLISLRVFNDKEGKINLSIKELAAEFLVVSEFTLLANCKKGLRPSFQDAESSSRAEELYRYFLNRLKSSYSRVKAGIFGAKMKLYLLNDGPVTFILDSRE